MRATSLRLGDYGDFVNSISPNPTSIPSHATFDVRFAPAGAPVVIHDDTFGFAATYIPTRAELSFTARNVHGEHAHVTYRSLPGEEQTTVSGGVGTERNGVFFA